MRTLTSAVLASSILLVGSAAGAHEPNSMQGMNMPGMKVESLMGTHDMSASVKAVDSKTGLVDVNADGLALKIHFPPAALMNVKAGDHVTLHLAFTKP